MQSFENPLVAADAVADYVTINYGTIPPHLQQLALEAVRRPSPVERLVKGMELLLAAALADGMDDRQVGLNLLGGVAAQVAAGAFWSKGDRAVQIMSAVKGELGELPAGIMPADWPEVDPEYEPA